MAWPTNPRPAKALIALRQQVIALAPNRSTSSEGPGLYGGMLASSEHHATNPTSDHEANTAGVVTATDITNDPQHGMSSRVLAQQLLDSHDDRVKYIISNRQIASGSGQAHEAWVWRPYSLADTGDPHTGHCHISLKSDAAHYDDARPWGIHAQIADSGAEPTAPGKPILKFGSIGVDVKLVQQLVLVDGYFGPVTEAAVRDFQKSHGLTVDGVVGAHTWATLLQTFKPPISPVTPLDDQAAAISALASNSSLARVNWVGRGVAPIGYVKGMAMAFATCLDNLQRGDPAAVEMAKANTGNDEKDAISWYNSNFAKLGMSNDIAGADVLRALFVLIIGLGMRESSGKHCEGRDMSANNTSADTAEAGLFQMSWDAHGASPLIPQLLTKYTSTSDPTATLFAEGVTCSAANWANAGTGTGAIFQQLCKSKPGFAVETAAVGLRNLRKHWGPINRKEAELRPEAEALLLQVQQLVTTVPTETPAPAPTVIELATPSPIAPTPSPETAQPRIIMNDQLWTLIRYALIAGGTMLATYGYMKPEDVPGIVDQVLPAVQGLATAVGAVVTAAGAIWGLYVGSKTLRVPTDSLSEKSLVVNPASGAIQPLGKK